MTIERTIQQATAVVLKKEANILNTLYEKAEKDNATAYAVEKLFDEVERQDGKDKFDEEEYILGRLLKKKKNDNKRN